MDSILSWNVRGMNIPNKQEDIKIFLQQQQAGFVGFLETNIKDQNIALVMGRICPNWNWIHNASAKDRDKIIVCWHPRHYLFNLLHMTNQMIHGEVIQMSTTKKFFITFVYGKKI